MKTNLKKMLGLAALGMTLLAYDYSDMGRLCESTPVGLHTKAPQLTFVQKEAW